jgi:hypothetical protein
MRTKPHPAIGLTMVAASLLLGCAAGDWETRLSMRACVERARLALRDADFNENTAVIPTSSTTALVAGEHGAYQAKLTCADGAVQFLVEGPDYRQSLWYKDTIIRKF